MPMLVVLVPLDFILKVLLIIDFDVEVDASPSDSISWLLQRSIAFPGDHAVANSAIDALQNLQKAHPSLFRCEMDL